tara:strand:+ start:265 stop:438 length:174 start_codon:yes stop_codon:yes gene_type:complete
MDKTKRGKDKATKYDVENFITDTAEYNEIIRDMLNGDYTVEALISDYKEWKEEYSTP